MLPTSAPTWLEDRMILLTRTGSHAYGTATKNSDMDYKGVCIPPVEYFLGLESFNEFNTTGGKNFKNTHEDTDYSVLHVNKFVKDAMSGVPNNIEILFVRPKDRLYMNHHGAALVDNRQLFLSKQILKKFGGYAKSQMIKMQKSRALLGTGKDPLVEQYGYDTKQFMHTVRLQTSAIEILSTGNYSTYRPNHILLRSCRQGLFSFEEALELLEYNEQEMQAAAADSKLPEYPDYNRISELLIKINRQALDI